MNLLHTALVLYVLSFLRSSYADDEVEYNMVKMCLFYDNASGHARSDPILNQACPSDHVHTFYGPQNFHPDTTYEQLRDIDPKYSSSPWIENQSLYWHPSIYEVSQINGQTTYNRVSNLETSPYYRWDTSTTPVTVAFPPGFRMIASSDQDGADASGDIGGSLLVECCDLINDDEESCVETLGNPLTFPTLTCDFLGIAFAMPTCWDESKGIGINDPYNHVAYTTDGTVSGPCPAGYNKRLPQIQLFVRINNYKGQTHQYQLADGRNVFHVDFMNGWQEGKLQQILDNCEPTGEGGYNPPCDCTQFLTANEDVASAVCDDDVKQYILDEETATVATLPRGTCQGTGLITKSWALDPPFQCVNESNESNDECTDSELDFEINNQMRDCDWVADDPDNRCSFVGVEQLCPVTCDSLQNCDEGTNLVDIDLDEANGLQCFSSHTTVNVEGKGTTVMEDVKVGDRVLSSNGEYVTIYSIDHRDPTKSTTFIQIHTEAQQSPLELTHRHMLFVEGNSNPVPVASLKIGDKVHMLQGPTAITKINIVTRTGVFSLLTVDGTIVASGIVASTYSAFLSNSEWIEIAGLKIISHQSFYNIALKPYRYMCTGLSLELCKTSTERVAISEFANNLYEHSRRYSKMIQIAILSLVLLCVGVYSFILSPYSLILALVACWNMARLSKNSKSICFDFDVGGN